MGNLMKAELCRFRKEKSMWLILLVLLCCSGIAVFLGNYKSAETAFRNITRDYMPLVIAWAVYAGFAAAGEFSGGGFAYKIAAGYSRAEILAALFVHYLLGCLALLLLYPGLTTLLCAAVQGVEGSFAYLLFRMGAAFVRSILPTIGVAACLFFLCVLIRKKAAAMGVCIGATLLTGMLNNNLELSRTPYAVLAGAWAEIPALQLLPGLLASLLLAAVFLTVSALSVRRMDL